MTSCVTSIVAESRPEHSISARGDVTMQRAAGMAAETARAYGEPYGAYGIVALQRGKSKRRRASEDLQELILKPPSRG